MLSDNAQRMLNDTAPAWRSFLRHGKQKLQYSLKSAIRRIWKYRLSYLFMAPFLLVFTLFIIIPVVAGVVLSFTHFNSIELPQWDGWTNYRNLLSQDVVFLRHIIPNSFKFALFVGPVGYVLAFLLAWLIAQLPGKLRTGYALAMYMPSLTGGVAMVVVWQVVFTGDRTGYLNNLLLKWNLIEQPLLFTIDAAYLMPVMIIVATWSSMGLGFLAILAGILNIDRQIYEAAKIDGMRSRLQEIWYLTIPLMKPQMLFAAVMAIANTLKSGQIGTQLSGLNPTPNYAGQLFNDHIRDFGFTRLELGYASSISIVLLLVTVLFSRAVWSLLGSKEGE